ncbi:hypothetical protein Emed_004367 [Eimeria media]
MRIPTWALPLLLLVGLKQLIQDTTLGSCNPEAFDVSSATGRGETQGPQEGIVPGAAQTSARGTATQTVEQFCGGPEDLSACDLVRDGVCILSASPLRLWRRRRWREARRAPQRQQQRWVEGLRIRTKGDIEVPGAVIQCTQSAPTWSRVAVRRRRLRAQGFGEESGGLASGLRVSGSRSRVDSAQPQRIELCAVGSIRLGRGAKLHCTETILFAGDAVSVAETAEVTATGTVLLRGPQLLDPTNAATTATLSAVSYPEELTASSPESVAGRLRGLLGMASHAETPSPYQAADRGAPGAANIGATQAVSQPSVNAAGSEDAGQSEKPADLGPFAASRQEAELRGGSHGGLGGVACGRCETTVFSHPLSVSLRARGNLFLPVAKGEAGLLYSSNMGPLEKAGSPAFLNPLVRSAASVQPPRGGGLVVIVALRRLAVDGQVTSSGEPGWGCETQRNPFETKGSVSPVKDEVANQKRRYVGSGSLRRLVRRLLTNLTRGSESSSTYAQVPPAATCATAGSGGSIVLASEVLTFASPIQTGRVAATGGGCLSAPPGARWSAKATVDRGSEGPSGECAAGGGGRIAIYAEQPHPLDPVVLASGGCALRSSRLNLLPCLCGGGGTVFSRAHRRLVISNKLHAAAAASAVDAPSHLSLRSRSQQSVAAPHTFEPQQQACYEGTAGPAEALRLHEDEAATVQSKDCSEGSMASSASSSATDTLAVLSVQPTPLPVPLHAPSIAVAVEAAVVSIGGTPKRSSADQEFAGTSSQREPKVVVGSLLLHGGTRGSALHVLTPLHLHAAEGSIRLRQRSALLLAPCGGSGGEKGEAQSEASCSLESLPQAGVQLRVSVVVSSAVSVSVGEEAAIRFTPRLTSFSRIDPADPSAPSSQQSSSEDFLLGVGLLAGERLLLHGVLGLVNAPSDCLPAPLRKTPLLLYGGTEVSVRGEQQLDRLIILSQGKVTLAGRCTVGAPHSCSATRTPLLPTTPGSAEDPMKHSAVCRDLEEFGTSHVAEQLRAAAETEGQSLDATSNSRPFKTEGNFTAPDDQSETLATELQKQDAGKNHTLSVSRFTDEVTGEKKAKGEGWLTWLFRRLQHFIGDSSQNADPPASYLSALDGLLQVRYPFSLKSLQLQGELSDLSLSSGHERGKATEVEDEVSVTPPYRFDAAHLLTGDLLRKKWKTRESLVPLVNPFVLTAASTQRGPLFAELMQKQLLTSFASIPSPRKEIRMNEFSLHWDILAKGEAPHEPSDTGLKKASTSLDEPDANTLRSSAAEAATHLSVGEKREREPLLNHGGGSGPLDGLTGAGNDYLAAQNETAKGAADPQGAASSSWASLDAAVFASEGVILESGASLKGGTLLLCGGRGTVLLQGTVDASGRGCQPTQGPGAGSRGHAVNASLANPEAVSSPAEDAHFALCGAGGGGHAGSGGDGAHALTRELCRGTGGAAYDRGPSDWLPPDMKSSAAGTASEVGEHPSFYASTVSASGGGGDVGRAGSGGGVVWVQGQSVVVDGVILADGGGGELMQDAIIDLDVDPQNCPLLGTSAATATKGLNGEASEPSGKEVSLAASSPSHEGMKGTTYAARELSDNFTAQAAQDNLEKDDRSLEVEEVKGGPGGGSAKDTVSCQLSSILSDPGQLGQGGGGGGSIVIETRALLGSGLISAVGGHGGRCTGGGGGGGAVNFLWNPFFVRISSQASRQQHASSSSTNRSLIAAGKCQSLNTTSVCGKLRGSSTEALAGKGFSEHGQTDVFVPWIQPLEFAAGFSGSVRVDGGKSDPSTACGPLHLPLGGEGTPGEVRNPLGCPPGYSGWRCTPCPVGFYSLGGSSACLSCSNKPSNQAFYIREGVGNPQCPYACAAGLPDASVNPQCLPPFIFVVSQLLCCSVLITLSLLCLVVLGIAALLRELAGRRGQQGWGSASLVGPGESSVPVSISTLESTGSSCGFGPSPSSSLGFLGGSNERRRMHLAVPHLTLEDLPFHVFRIYLHGRNSPHSPWGLDGQPPPFLSPLITSHRFAAFASAANALCGFSRCFVRLYNVLSFLYPPLAALLLRAARARRANKMIVLCSGLAGRPSREGAPHGSCQRGTMDAFLSSWFGWRQAKGLERFGGFAAASFWRNIRAREISFALKFGCDPDCTLGFIDVLDLDRNILDYRCSPQLPLVLLTQGDGRIVPFSLSRSLRTPEGSRAAWRSLQADGTGRPADPLQAALEELASPSIWGCIAEIFNAKVKEVAAGELAAMRSLLIAAHTSSDAGVAQGAPLLEKKPDEGRRWEGSLGSSRMSEFSSMKHEAACAFPRCGRCGRVQLPSLGRGRFNAGPLSLLLGDPLYALRAVGRLCECIRLISDRLLKPHGIAATVCLMANSGFVSRANGVQRVAGNLEGAAASLRAKKASHRPTASSSPPRKPASNASTPASQGPLDAGRRLLRAASSPSALLDSLRRGSEESAKPNRQDTHEGSEEENGGRAAPASGTSSKHHSGRLRAEQGASTSSLEAAGLSSKQGLTYLGQQNCEEGEVTVDSEAVLALIITEVAAECDGNESSVAAGQNDVGSKGEGTSAAVVVQSLPPVSSLAITSPLDPRRLSPANKSLAPYIPAAATALNKSMPYWGPGASHPHVLRGPSSSRFSQDRQILGCSPAQQMPGSFRGVRRILSPFNESFADSQGTNVLSPQGSSSWGLTEVMDATVGSDGDPVMCLADAAKRIYVLTAALAVHFLHTAATCVYLFGLQSTSFSVAWPEPFPSGSRAAGDFTGWAVPVNSFWFRGEDLDLAAAPTLVVSPPLQGPGVGPSPASNAVAKWTGLSQGAGGPSWSLLAVALSFPPLADLLCFVVGLWLFVAADVRQEQLFCMSVAATMPKHILVYGLLLMYGTSLTVAFFGLLELVAMAALKLLLCMLASMFVLRVETPEAHPIAATKELELLRSIAQRSHKQKLALQEYAGAEATRISADPDDVIVEKPASRYHLRCVASRQSSHGETPSSSLTSSRGLGEASFNNPSTVKYVQPKQHGGPLAPCDERLPQSDIRSAYQKASLNGDGFGVGWYTNCVDAAVTGSNLSLLRDGSTSGEFGVNTPLADEDSASTDSTGSDLTNSDSGACVFTSLKPAWADRNLFNLAEKISSRLFFAHVRAASSTLGISHCAGCDGGLPQWAVANGSHRIFCIAIKRASVALTDGPGDLLELLSLLPDPMFSFAITNSCIDSACLFAIFLALLPGKPTEPSSPSAMKEAVQQMISTICWLLEREEIEEITLINIVVSDGECIVATRFVTNAQEVAYESGKAVSLPIVSGETSPAMPASLYFATGTAWQQEQKTLGEFRMTHRDKRTDICIVTSEPLTSNPEDWMPVPRNTMILITPAIDLLLYPIASAGFLPPLFQQQRRDMSRVPPEGPGRACFDTQLSVRKDLATALADRLQLDVGSLLEMCSGPRKTPRMSEEISLRMLRSLEGVIRELSSGGDTSADGRGNRLWRALERKLKDLEKQMRAAQAEQKPVAIEDSRSAKALSPNTGSPSLPSWALQHEELGCESTGGSQHCYELVAGTCAILCLESIVVCVKMNPENGAKRPLDEASGSSFPVAAKTFVFAGMQSGAVNVYDATSASAAPISFHAHVGGVLAMAIHVNPWKKGSVSTGRVTACADCGCALPEVFLVTGGSDTTLAVWDLSPLLFGGREPCLLSGSPVLLDGPKVFIAADDLLAVRLSFLPHQGDVLSLLVTGESDEGVTSGCGHDRVGRICTVGACESCLQGIRFAMRLDSAPDGAERTPATSPLASFANSDLHKMQSFGCSKDEADDNLLLIIGFQSAKIGAIVVNDLLRYFRHTQVMVSVLANAVSVQPTQQHALPLRVSREFELKTLASGQLRVMFSREQERESLRSLFTRTPSLSAPAASESSAASQRLRDRPASPSQGYVLATDGLFRSLLADFARNLRAVSLHASHSGTALWPPKWCRSGRAGCLYPPTGTVYSFEAPHEVEAPLPEGAAASASPGTYRVVTSTSSLRIVAQPSGENACMKIEMQFLPFEQCGVKRQRSHQSLVGPWLDESGHNGFVECLTRCGKVICSGGGDGRLLLWGEAGNLVGELSGHHGGVLCVAYTEAPFDAPCRDLRTPEGDQGEQRERELAEAEAQQSPSRRSEEVLALAADASRNLLVSGSANGELFVWQLDLMVVAFRLTLNAVPARADMALSPVVDGHRRSGSRVPGEREEGVSFTDILLISDVSSFLSSSTGGATGSSLSNVGRGDGKLGVWNLSEIDIIEESFLDVPDYVKSDLAAVCVKKEASEDATTAAAPPEPLSPPAGALVGQLEALAARARTSDNLTEGQQVVQSRLSSRRLSGIFVSPGASMPSLPSLTGGGGLEPRRSDFLPLLAQFVAYKSVSASRSHPYISGCIGAAKFVAQLFEQALGANVDIVWPRGSEASSEFYGDHGEEKPHPVVFGRLGSNPQHPTIVFYSHYDVVPAETSWDLCAHSSGDVSDNSYSPARSMSPSRFPPPYYPSSPLHQVQRRHSMYEVNKDVEGDKRPRRTLAKPPVWREMGWDTNPWKVHCKDGYFYGRGVSDNKGPIICSLLAVKQFIAEWRRKHKARQTATQQTEETSTGAPACQEGLKAVNDPAVPFNFVWICEGDEENGSMGLADAVAQKASWLQGARYLICNNSYWADDTTPCLVYGMRGVLDIRVEATNGAEDQHSGLHGGVVEEPMQHLVHLLGRLWDPGTGRVTVPRFYDSVQAPDAAELQRVRAAAESLAPGSIAEECSNVSDSPETLLRKRWLEPSLSLLDINSSFKGKCVHVAGATRVIPSTACAEIRTKRSICSDRTASAGCVQENGIQGKGHRAVPATRASMAGRLRGASDARIVWGVDPLYIREGGSMPAIPFLADVLRRLPGPLDQPSGSDEVAVCQLPFGQASDNAHLPNERLGIRQVEKGVDVLAFTLESLAVRLTSQPCSRAF